MFRKYNFIAGGSSTGKTQILNKIAVSFSIPGLFLDAESGIIISNPKFKSYSVQNFPECQKLITDLGEDSHFVILDCLHCLTVPKNKTFNEVLKEFFTGLPKQHTYFFSTSINNSPLDVSDNEDYFKNIKRSLSLVLDLDIELISLFESKKKNSGPLSPFEIINHDTNESYNIGSIESLIRDYKINQLL